MFILPLDGPRKILQKAAAKFGKTGAGKRPAHLLDVSLKAQQGDEEGTRKKFKKPKLDVSEADGSESDPPTRNRNSWVKANGDLSSKQTSKALQSGKKGRRPSKPGMWSATRAMALLGHPLQAIQTKGRPKNRRHNTHISTQID